MKERLKRIGELILVTLLTVTIAVSMTLWVLSWIVELLLWAM